MATFTYTPDNAAQLSEKPRVLVAQMGDGYQLRVADGINVRPREWMLTFNTRTDAEIAPILAFLRAQNGVTSFDWTDPNGDTGKYITPDGWQHTKVRYGINDLSVKFRQVYEP